MDRRLMGSAAREARRTPHRQERRERSALAGERPELARGAAPLALHRGGCGTGTAHQRQARATGSARGLPGTSRPAVLRQRAAVSAEATARRRNAFTGTHGDPTDND